jgi:hypothetical protein
MSISRPSPQHLQASQTSLQDTLQRALRDEAGRAALRVFPGAAREAQRLVFALLREAADIKGGSLIEIMPNDWLLTELPDPEAERLRKLLQRILGEAAVQLLPLPASKTILTGLLNAARQPQFLDVSETERVSPLGLRARLDRLDLAQVYRRQSIVGMTDARRPRLVFQRLALDHQALRQYLRYHAKDRSLESHARAQLQKRTLEALGDEGMRQSLLGGGPVAPLFIGLTPDLLPPTPTEPTPRMPPAHSPALYAALSLHEAISINNLAARREALRQDAWGIAITGLSAAALSLVQADVLPADWLMLDWSPALEDPQALKTLRRLDQEHLILDGCDGEEAVSWGLSQGIHLFGGPWIEDIIAAGRMALCSEAARCLRSECRARGMATSPSERQGCHKPPMLEAVLPEGHS